MVGPPVAIHAAKPSMMTPRAASTSHMARRLSTRSAIAPLSKPNSGQADRRGDDGDLAGVGRRGDGQQREHGDS